MPEGGSSGRSRDVSAEVARTGGNGIQAGTGRDAVANAQDLERAALPGLASATAWKG